ILYAAINGHLDDVPVEQLADFESDFHRYMETSQPEVGKAISTEKDISTETEEALKAGITGFKQTRT
ncbi:MAG: F0F1 ATP synthase subunit alpha, partial [Dehalococcoidales bacterium]